MTLEPNDIFQMQPSKLPRCETHADTDAEASKLYQMRTKRRMGITVCLGCAERILACLRKGQEA